MKAGYLSYSFRSMPTHLRCAVLRVSVKTMEAMPDMDTLPVRVVLNHMKTKTAKMMNAVDIVKVIIHDITIIVQIESKKNKFSL